jgi:Uma2 family endonuclease
MVTVRQGLSLEEFLRLPEDKPALEYAEGTVTQKVSPRTQHSALQFALCRFIDDFARQPRQALAFPELRFTFAGHSYVPDVSVYRWRRIPREASGRLADDVFVPPDLAIEIRSPDQSVAILVERCHWYVAHEVTVALLVDPMNESIRAFRNHRPTQTLRDADRIDLPEVLPGFDLTVQTVFDALNPF